MVITVIDSINFYIKFGNSSQWSYVRKIMILIDYGNKLWRKQFLLFGCSKVRQLSIRPGWFAPMGGLTRARRGDCYHLTNLNNITLETLCTWSLVHFHCYSFESISAVVAWNLLEINDYRGFINKELINKAIRKNVRDHSAVYAVLSFAHTRFLQWKYKRYRNRVFNAKRLI